MFPPKTNLGDVNLAYFRGGKYFFFNKNLVHGVRISTSYEYYTLAHWKKDKFDGIKVL
jgi:hypothetical protein